jgi:adenylylsulfate kinase
MSGVVWITGLSGAGKSTLARRVTHALREDGAWVLHLDGDEMRAVFGDDLGHGPEDRKKNAWRIARTCAFLAGQGALVVCSTVSLFPEIWAYNRSTVRAYLEVYLDVPLDVLIARDHRGIYLLRDVAGVDVAAPRPQAADLVLESAGPADLDRNAAIVHARTLAMIGAPARPLVRSA